MVRLRITFPVLALLALSAGCSALLLLRPASRRDRHPVDFREALEFAERADAAYLRRRQIRRRYRDYRVHVQDLPESDVRFFVLVDDRTRTQHIAVRGTSNLTNIRVDATFTPEPDVNLGVPLHLGFSRAGAELHENVRPYLKRDYRTTVTGHSLGGALAAILGMHLKADGYRVTRVITFGQPKVTNVDGARRYGDLPILRFVNRNDPVAEVPPLLSLRDVDWRYSHVGPEVILWTGNRYIYVERHQALFTAVLSFWGNLGNHEVAEHTMEAYLASLRNKVHGAEEIRFEERNNFLD